VSPERLQLAVELDVHNPNSFPLAVQSVTGLLSLDNGATLGAASAEPFFELAKGANKRCVELSVKFQHTSPAARRCGDWLAERFPDEQPRMTELVPRLLVAPSALPRPEPITDRSSAP
jgi:hypothetical protein